MDLHDNPFSPFARKVRLVLAHKGVKARSIDALTHRKIDGLRVVNPRGEVPVLVDGGIVVVNSSHIVSYLEDKFPDPSVLPSQLRLRVEARDWERVADTLFDSVIHDMSIWGWPTHRRTDEPPQGLLAKAYDTLHRLLLRMENALEERDFLCRELGLADYALLPHISSLKGLGISLDDGRFENLRAWYSRMRNIPHVQKDIAGVKEALADRFTEEGSPYEGEKIVWRGDRIEWLLSAGYEDWFIEEIKSGRAVFPAWQA